MIERILIGLETAVLGVWAGSMAGFAFIFAPLAIKAVPRMDTFAALVAGTLPAAYGARIRRFGSDGPRVTVLEATDDGSRGHHGAVTDLVANYIEWADAIYAYAPGPVYVALRDALRRYRGTRTPPPVQAAMERSMACGMGVCLGCVVETTSGLKTVCRDGPVFALDQLVLG